jgi:hypothetical protein
MNTDAELETAVRSSWMTGGPSGRREVRDGGRELISCIGCEP